MYDAQKNPVYAKFNKLKMNLKMGETPKDQGVNYLKKHKCIIYMCSPIRDHDLYVYK